MRPSGDISEQGHLTYLTFDSAVKLSVNQRVQGYEAKQLVFKDL